MKKKLSQKKGGSLAFRADSLPYRILEEISAGDLFVGFLLSGRSTKRMYQVAAKRAVERYRNKHALTKLKAHGYVGEAIVNGASSFFITKEGKQALHELYKTSAKQRAHPEVWDGVWRVVIV